MKLTKEEQQIEQDLLDGNYIPVADSKLEQISQAIFNRKKELVYSKSSNDEDATSSPATYTGGSNTGVRITRLGTKADGGSPAGGVYGDMGVYSEALSDANVELLIDFLATKFGISQS